MRISRAVVLACVAALGGESTVHATPPAPAPVPNRPAWTEGAPASIDLFPLLDVSLRRELDHTTDDLAPEPMNGDARAIAYPMVPAPAAGESGIAFGALLLLGLAYRFWRYGRLSLR